MRGLVNYNEEKLANNVLKALHSLIHSGNMKAKNPHSFPPNIDLNIIYLNSI